MQASRRTWRIGQVKDVDVHFVVYRDTMEHRAASLVGQKLAAAQLLYGDSVEGALIDQSDSGHGFLADLARSVIERAEVTDLNQLFRQVSLGGREWKRERESRIYRLVVARVDNRCIRTGGRGGRGDQRDA